MSDPLKLKEIETLAGKFTVRLEGSEESHARDLGIKAALTALVMALRETRTQLNVAAITMRNYYAGAISRATVETEIEQARIVLARVQDESPDNRWAGISEEDSKRVMNRLVSLWILGGKKNADKPEVQDWLLENGYGHLIP